MKAMITGFVLNSTQLLGWFCFTFVFLILYLAVWRCGASGDSLDMLACKHITWTQSEHTSRATKCTRFRVSTYNQHQMKAITEGFAPISTQVLGWFCITWTRSERTSRATKGMRRSLSSCAMIWPTRPKPAMTTWPRSSSTSPSLGCSACATHAFMH